MTAEELWQAYRRLHPTIGDNIDAWAFGAEPDLLAQLVHDGIKTATASAYDEYVAEGEALSEVGELSVVLDSQGNGVCIIETTKVSVVPFKDVSEDHAFKEGEGNRSLYYWREVHRTLFTEWLGEIGIAFTEESKVVLEEFRVVFTSEEATEHV